jgi:hypothetical protein
MDELASCYIEVHPDRYQLKMFDQLSERMLGDKYLKPIENCHQMLRWARSFDDPRLIEDTIKACNYIQYHLVGKAFQFENLAQHLLIHRSPNMQQFVSQVMGEVWDTIDLNVVIPEIDPLALNWRCQGRATIPARSQTGRPSQTRNIWVNFGRRWEDDVASFSLNDDDFGSRFSFNSGREMRESEPTEERILEYIGWAVDRGE